MKSGTTLFRQSLCVRCNQPKFKKGVKRRGGTIIYVDKANRKWIDRTCPKCRIEAGYVALTPGHMQAFPDLGPATPIFAPKLRSCRDCGKKTHNYYRCERCNGDFLRGASDNAFEDFLGQSVSDLSSSDGWSESREN